MSQKYLAPMSALILAISGLSMNWNADDFGILDQDDYALVDHQTSPALQTAIGEEPHLESFNEWQCFSSASAKFDCYEEKSGKPAEDIDSEERDGKGYYPTIIAERDGHTFAFEAPGWVELASCRDEVATWKRQIDGQPGFCVFAASWPPDSQESTQNEGSEWVMYGLKTHAGRILAPVYDPNARDDTEQLEE